MALISINPATGETLQQFEEFSLEKIQIQIQKTELAFQEWKKSSFDHRSKLMKNAQKILLNQKEKSAHMISNEMGKPLKQARAEIEKCALVCEYYADHAEEFLRAECIPTEAYKSYVSYEPLGIVLAIMPWNFPFWQVFRFAAPTLMAGNAAILKHANNVSACALAIENIFLEAGFPQDLFASVLCGVSPVKKIIEHPLIKAVSLTGSKAAGQAVASQAAFALKKTVLELGGSDAFVVLEDANIDLAVQAAAASRLLNAGQTCIAAKRFIIPKKLQKEFENKLILEMKKMKMGNPLDEDTDIGPMARADLRDTLHEQVLQSISQGATLLLGGEIPAGKGNYYPPTILSEVKKNMRAYSEELFGPVASMMIVENEEEAIRVANDTEFGLGAVVFTQDLKRGEEIAQKKLDVGCCFVNSMLRSDPRLPFGGIKNSGYGRELAQHGIKEFVNVKSIYIKVNSE